MKERIRNIKKYIKGRKIPFKNIFIFVAQIKIGAVDWVILGYHRVTEPITGFPIAIRGGYVSDKSKTANIGILGLN